MVAVCSVVWKSWIKAEESRTYIPLALDDNVVFHRLDAVDGNEEVTGVVEVEIDGTPRDLLVGFDDEIVHRSRFEIHRNVVEQSELGAVGTHDGLPREIFSEYIAHAYPYLLIGIKTTETARNRAISQQRVINHRTGEWLSATHSGGDSSRRPAHRTTA